MTRCVGAHDRCYGGAGGPCPYCEGDDPPRDNRGRFVKEPAMTAPSPEILELVTHICTRFWNDACDKPLDWAARLVDTHIAARTAELRKIISDQSDAHVAHMKSVDEANERRLDAYKARLAEEHEQFLGASLRAARGEALRAAADAMAKLLEKLLAEEGVFGGDRWNGHQLIAAYRALSPAGEETCPQHR